jgi:hypothetical protein
MNPFSHDVGGAVEAYAAYLNAPRGILDREEQMLFDEDLARARAAMELACLEATPVREVMPGRGAQMPARGAQRIRLALSSSITRLARRALARA